MSPTKPQNFLIFERFEQKGFKFFTILTISGKNIKKWHLNQYYKIFLGKNTNSNASSDSNTELYQVWNTACEPIIGKIVIVHILEPFRYNNDSFNLEFIMIKND